MKRMCSNREKIEELRKLGEKYANTTEFFDKFITVKWDKLRFPEVRIINQIGDKILEICNAKQ